MSEVNAMLLVLLDKFLRCGKLRRSQRARIVEAIRLLRYVEYCEVRPEKADIYEMDAGIFVAKLVAKGIKLPPPLEYEDGYPVLYRDTITSQTDPCPFCGERHFHGKLDGHVHSHCDCGQKIGGPRCGYKMITWLDNRGYILRTRRAPAAV